MICNYCGRKHEECSCGKKDDNNPFMDIEIIIVVIVYIWFALQFFDIL